MSHVIHESGLHKAKAVEGSKRTFHCKAIITFFVSMETFAVASWYQTAHAHVYLLIEFLM